jgi:hypothetical protein
MAVKRGNGGKPPGGAGGGGRSRPDFTPSRSTGLYLRFDCVAGRAKIVGHASGELFSRKCRFNIDINRLEAGYLDFQANAESAIVGTDKNNPPLGAGGKDVLKWGAEVRVAMPYATTFDDVEIDEVPPCVIRTTSGLQLEALGTLWDAYFEDTKHQEGDIAYVEIAGWEPVTMSGGKKYFRPRFKILGYVKDLEEQFAGANNSSDDNGD